MSERDGGRERMKGEERREKRFHDTRMSERGKKRRL
jgi:hypothetical protein